MLTPDRYQIIIDGEYGAGNFGDDLLMTCIVKGLLDNGVLGRIALLTKDPGYASRWFPSVTAFSRSAPYKINADVYLYGGGTQFFSFINKNGGQSLHQRILRGLLAPKRTLCRVCIKKFYQKIKFKRMAAVSLGIGPFAELATKQHAIKTIADCGWVAVRDKVSLDILCNAGVNHVELYPDLVFADQLWLPDTLIPTERQDLKRIGIIVRDWPHSHGGASYLEPLIEAARRFRQSGYDIQFVSFAEQYDTVTLRRLNAEGIDYAAWSPDKWTIPEFLRKLVNCDLFISARAHGVIVGAVFGVPSVAIEVEPKMRIMAEQFSSSLPVWGGGFEPEVLLRIVDSLHKNWPNPVKAIRADACIKRKLACQSMTALSSWILESPLAKE